jgi:MerR family mercuric resistance operon transcriptional regulator
MHKNVISIGDLSEATGVKIETIRYYERIGLLPAPARSDGGRRLYGERHRHMLHFIRSARELGFQIADVRMLLALSEQRGREAEGQAKALTLHHLETVRKKIASLQKLEKALEEMAGVCRPGEQAACPIVEALSSRAQESLAVESRCADQPVNSR